MQDEPYSRTAASPVTDDQTAYVLDQAATVIEANGWCQEDWWEGYREQPGGNEWEPGRACCLATALAVATGRRRRIDASHILQAEAPAAAALSDWLALAYPARLLEWNDHPSRTREQVVDALRDTAAFLRHTATPVARS